MEIPVFDPIAYLKQLDPNVAYSCERLTGGVVNTTLRATKQTQQIDNEIFPGHSSLILKHAPPYIAGVGEAAPMTQQRQIIEANALSLFSPASPSSLHSIANDTSISIPAALHHDPNAHVLVLSDLGRLPNLSDVFSDLGGQTLGIATTQPDPQCNPWFTANAALTKDQTRFFQTIGTRLGSFFARLHHLDTVHAVLKQFSLTQFQSAEIRNVVLEFAIKPVRGQIKLCVDLASTAEADKLTNLLVEDFLRPTPENERSFALGDSWTGAVLVSLLPESGAHPEQSTVGVIDWEFAAFGRGIHGDMAQFLAHLEVLRISAHQDSKFTGQLEALDILISSITDTYRHFHIKNSKDKQSPSTQNENPLNTPFSPLTLLSQPPSATSLSAMKLRSAFLSHGAEIINIAFWKVWVCLHPHCPRARPPNSPASEGQHTPDSAAGECILVRRVVEWGLWFLRKSRGSVEEFCGREEWREMLEEALGQESMGRWGGGKAWLGSLF